MNPRHFETIKQSVEEYNKWRADNWNIKPDFSGANMHGMNLFKANLSNANLTDVDLSGAELISIEAYSAAPTHNFRAQVFLIQTLQE
ncbi:MAG: pentapeptide repeat-containing protein [Candidatus Eremiobacteraeota bacterium]|nr:pentapeptide repeat-containing protein [Candidatus Eremiobacteraeota bacterium]